MKKREDKTGNTKQHIEHKTDNKKNVVLVFKRPNVRDIRQVKKSSKSCKEKKKSYLRFIIKVNSSNYFSGINIFDLHHFLLMKILYHFNK